MKPTNMLITLFLCLAIAGCGNHNPKPSPSPSPSPTATPSPTPSPTPVQQAAAANMSFTRVRGMHVQAAQTKTITSLVTHGWFSLPTVEAATIVAVQQNWEGDCQSSPPVTNNTASITLFGVGQTVDETCSHSWVDNDTDGSKAAGFNETGKLVFGDGHISNLVVSTEKGTVIQMPVTVTVWVKRSGTVLSTGLTCALAVQNDEQICQSTTLFAVQNLDRVIVTITRNDGDKLVNLNAAFTKQIP